MPIFGQGKHQPGFKSWWQQKNPLSGNPKNSGTVLTCGACGWSGPCYHGVDAVVANPEGRGHPYFLGSPGKVMVGFPLLRVLV
jgi:hypothetical protein